MNLEDVIQSEINLSQKDKYGTTPLGGGTKSNQYYRDRKWMVIPGAGGREKWEVIMSLMSIQSYKMSRVTKMVGDNGCTTYECV